MSEQPFSAYQFEIYINGMLGSPPDLPMSVDALEAAARERFSPEAFS